MIKKIKWIAFFILTVVGYGHSRANDFDEVHIYYSVYEEATSKIYNSVDTESIAIVHDSITLLVYTEKHNNLYAASEDFLFIALGHVDYDPIYIGNIIQMKLTAERLFLIDCWLTSVSSVFLWNSLES